MFKKFASRVSSAAKHASDLVPGSPATNINNSIRSIANKGNRTEQSRDTQNAGDASVSALRVAWDGVLNEHENILRETLGHANPPGRTTNKTRACMIKLKDCMRTVVRILLREDAATRAEYMSDLKGVLNANDIADDDDALPELSVGPLKPCLEFMLQERVWEGMCALGLADQPRGMSVLVLRTVADLLRYLRHPLLPYRTAHQPLWQLIRVCSQMGEEDVQVELVNLLLVLWTKMRQNPHQLQFFIPVVVTHATVTTASSTETETGKVGAIILLDAVQPGDKKESGKIEISNGDNMKADTNESQAQHQYSAKGQTRNNGKQEGFLLFDALLPFVHWDNHIGGKARKGILIAASLGDENLLRYIALHTTLCQQTARELAAAFVSHPIMQANTCIYEENTNDACREYATLSPTGIVEQGHSGSALHENDIRGQQRTVSNSLANPVLDSSNNPGFMTPPRPPPRRSRIERERDGEGSNALLSPAVSPPTMPTPVSFAHAAVSAVNECEDTLSGRVSFCAALARAHLVAAGMVTASSQSSSNVDGDSESALLSNRLLECVSSSLLEAVLGPGLVDPDVDVASASTQRTCVVLQTLATGDLRMAESPLLKLVVDFLLGPAVESNQHENGNEFETGYRQPFHFVLETLVAHIACKQEEGGGAFGNNNNNNKNINDERLSAATLGLFAVLLDLDDPRIIHTLCLQFLCDSRHLNIAMEVQSGKLTNDVAADADAPGNADTEATEFDTNAPADMYADKIALVDTNTGGEFDKCIEFIDSFPGLVKVGDGREWEQSSLLEAYLTDAQRECAMRVASYARFATTSTSASTFASTSVSMERSGSSCDNTLGGPFLQAIFGKTERMLHNSFDENLVLTQVISALVQCPSQVLHGFLLDMPVQQHAVAFEAQGRYVYHDQSLSNSSTVHNHSGLRTLQSVLIRVWQQAQSTLEVSGLALAERRVSLASGGGQLCRIDEDGEAGVELSGLVVLIECVKELACVEQARYNLQQLSVLLGGGIIESPIDSDGAGT